MAPASSERKQGKNQYGANEAYLADMTSRNDFLSST